MELVVCAVILVSIAMVLNVISLKHELPPALQIFECVLVILCVIILYAILLDSIIVPLHDHHAIDDIDFILTLVRIGFCIVILLLVCHFIVLVVQHCSRRKTIALLQHLHNNATFLLVRIGAKRPQGYVVFSYRMDEEIGFCSRECAICLTEYEAKDKCALLDKCGHIFHHLCLHKCLVESIHCPLCRQNIKD